jgi:hypothetical protein
MKVDDKKGHYYVLELTNTEMSALTDIILNYAMIYENKSVYEDIFISQFLNIGKTSVKNDTSPV